MIVYRGCGILNKVIDRLPFELHIPGYRFCGPGTRLKTRLARGDSGINPLDEFCKAHDIAYDQTTDLAQRHRADQLLAKQAFQRARASNASIGEKLASFAVGSAMKAKVKVGMGRKPVRRLRSLSSKTKVGRGRKRRGIMQKGKRGGAVPFRRFIRGAWNVLKNTKPIEVLRAAKLALHQFKGLSRNVNTPRVIPVPKTGGFLPLIPLFAGLSALGALSGGAAGIAKAVGDAKAAKQELQESQRHNKTMEAIALGKGLHLKPYRKGLGLYLTYQKKNFR